MADWSKPTLSSLYTDFLTEVKNRDDDIAKQFDGTTSTNLVSGYIRWDSTANRWKKWNGTAWAELATTYALTGLSLTGDFAIATNKFTVASASGNTSIAGTLAVTGASTLTGNVGVGVTPTVKLQVDGTVGFSSGGTYLGSIFNNSLALDLQAGGNSTSGLRIGTSAATPAVVYTNGLERVRIDSSGSVGIGTSTPVSKLHVNSSGATATALTVGNINNGAVFGVDTLGLTVIGSYAGGATAFGTFVTGINTTFTERMRIDSAGNVGIGTTLNVGFAAGKWLQISTASVFGQQQNGTPNVVCNAYESAANSFNYILGAGAARYNVQAGTHAWFTAPSGTAGAAISFTQAMTLTASGQLGVGSGATAPGVTFYAAGTDAIRIPQGTTAQRPTGAAGMFRYNSTLSQYEGHNGSAWGKVGGGATGGGSDDIFIENGQTVTADYTITSGKNAVSAGAIVVASGVTVTVPTGSTWVIV